MTADVHASTVANGSKKKKGADDAEPGAKGSYTDFRKTPFHSSLDN